MKMPFLPYYLSFIERVFARAFALLLSSFADAYTLPLDGADGPQWHDDEWCKSESGKSKIFLLPLLLRFIDNEQLIAEDTFFSVQSALSTH